MTVTVFHRLPYRLTAVARSSQHAILASQTLGDLVNCMPCVSDELPTEVYEDDELVGYDLNIIHKNTGAVILIEGVLYGDGQSDQDYATYVNLPQTLSSMDLSEQQTTQTTRGTIPRPRRFSDQISHLTQFDTSLLSLAQTQRTVLVPPSRQL